MTNLIDKVTVLERTLNRSKAERFNTTLIKLMLVTAIALAAIGSLNAQETKQSTQPLDVVNHFFDKFKSGASAEELSNFFDEKAELYIPGDTTNVPWIGKRTGQKEISEHFRLLKEYIQPEKLSFTDMLTKGDRVVVLGYLESTMKRNGNVMKSEFSIDIIVKNGRIMRYHLLEDSFEVSHAVKP